VSTVQFVHCRDCQELFRPSPADRAPEFRLTPDGAVAEMRDDCMAFLTRHARHALETLRATGTPAVYTGPIADPMTSTTWEVSNGDTTCLVQSWRTSIAEPLHYRVVPGRLVADAAEVEVPSEDIRADLDRALFPHTAPNRKLDAFVDRFKAVAWELYPETLEIVYDLSGDPTLSVAKLPPWALDRLAVSAREIFDRTAAARIAARLTASADDPDAFTVLLRQRVRIE